MEFSCRNLIFWQNISIYFLVSSFFPQNIIICFLICLQIEQDWNDVFGKFFFYICWIFLLFLKKNIEKGESIHGLKIEKGESLHGLVLQIGISIFNWLYIFTFSLFLCEVHLSYFLYTFLTCDVCRKHAKYVLSNLLTACLLKIFIR